MADSSTVIGESILVNGNLTGDEDLQVLGKIEGAITLSKTLHVQESGIVKATVNVRNAVISGVVVGNITATDAVEITERGRMVGDIKAPRVIIVEGASFRGHVDMGDLEAPRALGGMLPARSELKGSGRPLPTRSSAPTALPPRARMPEPIRASAPSASAKPVAKGPPPAPPKPPQAVLLAKKKVLVKKH